MSTLAFPVHEANKAPWYLSEIRAEGRFLNEISVVSGLAFFVRTRSSEIAAPKVCKVAKMDCLWQMVFTKCTHKIFLKSLQAVDLQRSLKPFGPHGKRRKIACNVVSKAPF